MQTLAMAAIIRRATHADLDSLAAIDRVAASGDGERLAILSHGTSSGYCLVHVDDGQVLGFVITSPRHFFGRDFVELLMVAHSVRRSGVGRVLLRVAVRECRTPMVFTSTNRSNGGMRALLSSERWLFSGLLEGLDEGDPELVFYKHRIAETYPDSLTS